MSALRAAESNALILKKIDPYACPKCGKTFRRGLVMHAKYCKGT